MKILIDMNLSPLWIDPLIENGFEALHWSSVGDAKAKDTTILSWAREHGYVVFTNDLDFGHLLALTHAAGPSVIQVRSKDILPASIGTVVLQALRETEAALKAGALIVIDPTDFRVRILPI